ncbi:lantibiotic dehydratase C-terminal domain-containing protein [Curtobacterium sp. PhB78]|uniref:lantibiotic dehydratase C-terminal domain-containing protein n=1 Tax=Curtobacterium sp. PhB78 TaxID=2485102 RepID=UPI000F4A5BF9|nr:lantibiotic dehydratase C-terminal domain-containing protein [Curtobacterium sp. PhB78]ROS45986.1 thiopeptide-type bacteriocin biosynthesis protein [Curtobacterium sp. PhB78]
MAASDSSSPFETLEETLDRDRDHCWIAYHVFYGGSPDVLMRDCVVPLLESLVAGGVVTDWFYINYWAEGSHVRVRLRVHQRWPIAHIDSLVVEPVRSYLTRKPSMHPMVELEDNGFYERLFAGEFQEEHRPRFFHPDGSPRFRPNNSIERRPYEREEHRYGGAECMLLAERQFVTSTSLAVDVLQAGNQRVRTLLLGVAVQVSFLTAAALLADRGLVREFFVAYHRRWAIGYSDATPYSSASGVRKHEDTVHQLRKSLVPMLESICAGETTLVPERYRGWTAENVRVRQDLLQLFDSGKLRFAYDDGIRPPESAQAAAWSLCHSLVHMTNNRMMVSVADEAFVAFQIAAALDVPE